MLRVLDRMGRGALTVHGFRATFKTWASERTSFQNEIVEAALAHVIGGKVEQAYRRGDLFEKRRRLMQQWATFCITAPVQEQRTNVTSLRAS
jgi:integrase